MTVVEVTDEDFEEKVLEKSGEMPVLVDFWADWCMPCKQLSPILEDVADDLEGKVVLAKVNVDEAEETARKYNVRSIPNVKLFKEGKVVDEFVGAKPKEVIEDWLQERL